MKKVIMDILFLLYAIVAIFTTVCLLSYNDYKVTEFGNYSLVLITDDEVEPDYSAGDLVIVDKKAKINVGDKAFFYNTYNKEIEVSLGEVTDAEVVTSTETTYTIGDSHKVSGQYVLGTSKGTTTIAGVGTVLSILESKWGFLFLIVLPVLLAFLYQIGVVISQITSKSRD